MTWLFDPSGTTMDVYDHEGTLVASDRSFSGRWTDPPGFPDEVLDVMQESFQTGGPTAYNQQLLRDAALNNIEEGTP